MVVARIKVADQHAVEVVTEHPLQDSRCACALFATLNIHGLTHRDTVSRHRRNWQAAIDDGLAVPGKPGDDVVLPTIEYERVKQVGRPSALFQSFSDSDHTNHTNTQPNNLPTRQPHHQTEPIHPSTIHTLSIIHYQPYYYPLPTLTMYSLLLLCLLPLCAVLAHLPACPCLPVRPCSACPPLVPSSAPALCPLLLCPDPYSLPCSAPVFRLPRRRLAHSPADLLPVPVIPAPR